MSTIGTALITGASSGIGATYAKRLAARGYDLILVARDTARLEQLAELLIQQHAIQVKVLTADLTADQDVQRVEAELANNTQITLLLNNAGMSVEGEFLEADINCINTMLTLKSSLQPDWRRRQPGPLKRATTALLSISPRCWHWSMSSSMAPTMPQNLMC